MGKVHVTKSGLFVRKDRELGLLVFSPHIGMAFACQASDAKAVHLWLDGGPPPQNPVYANTLGAGWMLDLAKGEYPSGHLLPSPDSFTIPHPDTPIVINWLLTAKCPNACRYCYAADIMDGTCVEPKEKDIHRIAKKILAYNPLAVVLTGGDPLCSQHLALALDLLASRTAVLLDTSGVNLTPDLAHLFKALNIFVRVSLDAEIPKSNDILRVSPSGSENSSAIAFNAILQLLAKQVSVGVQTVATKKNRNDLEAFGNKLYRLGIRSWRILTVAQCKTNATLYKKLVGSNDGQSRFSDYIQKEIYSRHERGWNKGMGVQITRNDVPNSVVLVSPAGRFMTESKLQPGKIVLDSKSPNSPALSEMMRLLDVHAHVSRYLGP